MLKSWRYTIRPWLHWNHSLVAQNLSHIDPKNYPYCEICGARPLEQYRFKWFFSVHVNVRNALLGL